MLKLLLINEYRDYKIGKWISYSLPDAWYNQECDYTPYAKTDLNYIRSNPKFQQLEKGD